MFGRVPQKQREPSQALEHQQRGLSTRPNAVITSWELSFDHIRRTFPQAADLLSLMLCLNHWAIPQFLIQSIIDALVFSEVTAMLLNFSLVRAEIGQQTFEVYGLVQIAMRHWLERESFVQKWKNCAIERLTQCFPPSGSINGLHGDHPY